MNTTIKIGTDSGSRMCRNACQVLAPSIMAASSREPSMDSKEPLMVQICRATAPSEARISEPWELMPSQGTSWPSRSNSA